MTHSTVQQHLRLIRRLPPLLVFLTLVGAATEATAADHTFCFRYDDGIHTDQSPYSQPGFQCVGAAQCDRYQDDPMGTTSLVTATCVGAGATHCEYDLGETIERNDGTRWKMRHALVVIYEDGGPLEYSGPTNSNGCIKLSGQPINETYDVYMYPIYQGGGGDDIIFRVQTCEAGPCGYELAAFPNRTFSGTQTKYLTTSQTSSFSAYAAAAHVTNRLIKPDTFTASENVNFDILIFEDSGLTQNTFYQSTQQHFVSLSAIDAERKFNIAHEMGHAFVIRKLGLTGDDPDLLLWADDSAHAVRSKELQNLADQEGFAHIVAAAAYSPNYTGISSSVPFLAYDTDQVAGTVFDIEHGPVQHIATLCNPTTTCDDPGEGVEWDWAHGWWDFWTDSGSERPSFAELLLLYDTTWYWTNAWDPDNSHYADLRTWSAAVWNTTAQARFESKMEASGAAMGDLIYP